MLPRAVIFDWDNTLIDTFDLLYEAYNLTREKFGLSTWSVDEARANIRMAAKDVFPAMFGDDYDNAHKTFYDHVRAHHLGKMSVLDGAEDLLKYLSVKSIPLAIVSNKSGDILRKEVNHLNWGHFFSSVIGVGDYDAPGKPDPAGLNYALNQLEIENEYISNTWYVGDTENDLKTAHAARVIPVFVENHAMSNQADIIAQNPRHRFENCQKCLAYIRALG